MKIKSQVLNFIHLDRSFSLLTVKNTRLVLAYFNALDVHGHGKLNDIQFYQFMKKVTNLNKQQIFLVLDMLDQTATGYIRFQEFYLLACILISLKDRVEKQFIFRHSKLVFEMMDEDGGGTISADEFGHYGFLFNLKDHSVRDIFFEFDVSGDEELDYKEFKMFAMACIDKQRELDEKKKERMMRGIGGLDSEADFD
ncbi:EF-hand calcium-binding domain-containing protein 9-like [Styela clava]|uniref:EF-hand calcium-binding domain-containing protein 9-like n=1 Tax=Styela clava TaxID=7725 RepID=UPI00193A6334|nr:EF-hand calcium-binding domain-containing protein 9-like [Styela clava]